MKSLINEKLDNGDTFFTKEDYDNISSFRQQLHSILVCQRDSKTIELVNTFEKFINEIEPYLLSRPLLNQNGYQFNFYRIRSDNNPLKKRSDLFVIPKHLRHIVKSYRFSIPGSQCLYLSTNLELAWYECDMPMSFSACEYAYKPDFDYRNTKFLDFVITPIELKHYINFADNILLYKKYFYTFLLRAVCSIMFKTNGAVYKDEYVLPQLLMGWIRRNKYIAGIQYRSCSKVDQTEYLDAYNIAIPSKLDNNQYSDELWRSFNLSEPEYFSVNKIIKSNLSKIELTVFENLLSDVQIAILNSKKPSDKNWMNIAKQLLNFGKYYKVIYESVFDNTFELNRGNYYALQNTNILLTSNEFNFCDDNLLLNFYNILSRVSNAFRNISITSLFTLPSKPIFKDPIEES